MANVISSGSKPFPASYKAIADSYIDPTKLCRSNGKCGHLNHPNQPAVLNFCAIQDLVVKMAVWLSWFKPLYRRPRTSWPSPSSADVQMHDNLNKMKETAPIKHCSMLSCAYTAVGAFDRPCSKPDHLMFSLLASPHDWIDLRLSGSLNCLSRASKRHQACLRASRMRTEELIKCLLSHDHGAIASACIH